MLQHSPPTAEAQADAPAKYQAETLGVAFFDLSRMAEWSSSEQDVMIGNFLQQFYELAGKQIEQAGGRVVKFMGDAGLAVFPTDRVQDGVMALWALTQQARDLAGQHGIDTHLNVNVHVGPVLAGNFGPPSLPRFDVIGKTVNTAARLGRRGITLSAQAFRCLDPEARGHCEKITPPVTYRYRS